MSFSFQWPRFSEQFHANAIEMLNSALNKGTKPPVIADKIEVVELEMGTQPPELEIRDIGDLTTEQFRGIFRLTYAGDAHIVLRTKVQANPLNHKQPDIHLMTGSRGMLDAKKALVVPMLLRLSHFRLSSYVVLVVSKQKGITIVFKTDPLQNVDINSTFDSIAVIQKFIQREIEGQLRQMFREDLPGIIHRLSQQWVKAKIETPYLQQSRPPPPPPSPATALDALPPAPSLAAFPPHLQAWQQQQHALASRPPSVVGTSRHPMGSLYPVRTRPPSTASRSTSRMTSVSAPSRPPSSLRRQASVPPADAPEPSFPGLENFDPTYGLRPSSIPSKSVFGAFGRLFTPARGLVDLAEEDVSQNEEDEGTSYGTVEWEDSMPDYASMSELPDPSTFGIPDDNILLETIPAVGGGVITRPRVIQALSQARPPSSVALTPTSRAPSEAGLSSRRNPGSLAQLRVPAAYNPYFPSMGVTPPLSAHPSPIGLFAQPRHPSMPPTPPLYRSPPRRAQSPAPSTHTHPSGSSSHTHSLPTPTSTDVLTTKHIDAHRPTHSRHRSFSSSGSMPWPNDECDEEPKIVLDPSTVSHLSTLSRSNHTLSPYTRVPEHFAVRTGPAHSSAAQERVPVRARRKRIFRLGGKGKGKMPAEDALQDELDGLRRTGSTSPTPPSEFEPDEMDRYFARAHEPDVHVASDVVPGGQGDSGLGLRPHAWPPDIRQRRVFSAL